LYNPDTGQWSLYWASKRTGTLFPPVTGAFKDGVGEFFGEDTYNDVPILVHGRNQATLNRAGSGYARYTRHEMAPELRREDS
jgi:hypothetical protein